MQFLAKLVGKGPAGHRAAQRRLAARIPQRMKEGLVWSDRMVTPRPCSIRDLSVMGARVDLWDEGVKDALLTKTVTLFHRTDKTEVDCEIVWRRERGLGLRFLGKWRPSERKFAD